MEWRQNYTISCLSYSRLNDEVKGILSCTNIWTAVDPKRNLEAFVKGCIVSEILKKYHIL